jgi:hypothetical protein
MELWWSREGDGSPLEELQQKGREETSENIFGGEGRRDLVVVRPAVLRSPTKRWPVFLLGHGRDSFFNKFKTLNNPPAANPLLGHEPCSLLNTSARDSMPGLISDLEL